MRRSLLRLIIMFAGLFLLVVVSALAYQWGMRELEGEGRDFWRSLEWAAETLTTTGYGSDAEWAHPAMVLFVVGLQFIGVFFVFLLFPVFLIPFLEERFEARLPRQSPRLSGHVVIYRWGPAVESLLRQLERAAVPSVVVESDEATARQLLDEGHTVVYNPRGSEDLSVARLASARALIANGRDEENAGVVLGARQEGFEGEIIALVEEPFHRKPMMLAGANAVYTPRHVLGAALAARASHRISPRLSGLSQVGRLEVRELRVRPDSPLAGKTLAEAGVGARTGAIVIGQWVGGRLEAQPTAATRVAARGVLLVVGTEESLAELTRLVEGSAAIRRDGAFVVAGFGEVGRKVDQLLSDAGEEVLVVDVAPLDGVDVVGNVLDDAVLGQLGLEQAQGVILALDSDDATLFATVIARERAPDVPVIARVNHSRNLERIHRAGADFALSIAEVSGQILARRLLGEEGVTLDPALRLLKVSSAGLEGRHPAELGIRARTGCSVVAVERGELVVTSFGSDFRFAAGEPVYVCGSEAATRRYLELFAERS